MDSRSKKFYHNHVFDSRRYLEHYFSDKPTMAFKDDSLNFPMMNLHYVFSRGFIRGNLLIDISKGSFIHHLYSASNIFKDIIIMKFTEPCAMELRRWLDDRTGAFDWSHIKSAVAEMEGKSDQFENKELNLKASIRQIITCGLEKENFTDSLVLPLADCIISVGLLEAISRDQEDYMRSLGKISNLLRSGGHLILIGVFNATYFTIGPERFCMFKCDESFVRSALRKAGFVIDYCVVQRRKNVSDLSDYTHITCITAHKK